VEAPLLHSFMHPNKETNKPAFPQARLPPVGILLALWLHCSIAFEEKIQRNFSSFLISSVVCSLSSDSEK